MLYNIESWPKLGTPTHPAGIEFASKTNASRLEIECRGGLGLIYKCVQHLLTELLLVRLPLHDLQPRFSGNLQVFLGHLLNSTYDLHLEQMHLHSIVV